MKPSIVVHALGFVAYATVAAFCISTVFVCLAEGQDAPRPRQPIGAETQAELDAVTGASRGKSNEPAKNKAARERARKQWKRATGHNPEDVGC